MRSIFTTVGFYSKRHILFSLDWFEISQSVLALGVNIWLGVNLLGNFLNFKVFLHFRGPAVSLLIGASHWK